MTGIVLDLFAGGGGCVAPPKGAWDNLNGYWRLTVNGVRIYAHRHAYELVHGEIPSALVLDHLCRVRWCCNPTHLQPVSNEENILRGESPPARNARKTACPQGHDYVVRAGGARRCPQCDYQRRVATGETSGRGGSATRTHCPQGHAYDEANTYLVRRPDGSVKQRACRECGRAQVRARRARGGR